jgi:hypothetical protein
VSLRARAVVFVPAALYALLAAATFLDYGLTFDEPDLAVYGQRLARWYVTGGGDSSVFRWGDHHLYGGLFELLAHATRRLAAVFGLYEARHLLNTAFGLLAIAAVGETGRLLAGRLGGFLAALMLLAHPVFYGHSFNNPKDVPFAALWALATLAAVKAARRTDLAHWRGVVATGFGVGLALGMRVAGVLLLPGIAGLWLAMTWSRRRIGTATLTPASVIARATVMAAVAWAVMTALWPYAQLDPVRNPFRALSTFQSFHHEYVNLFEGRAIPSDQLPRRYLPEWLAVTWPDAYFLALPLGMAVPLAALAERRAPRRRRERALCALWVTAMTVGPVGWVVLTHPPLYDGMRHFLFVLPGLATTAGVGLAGALRRVRTRRRRAAAALVLLSPVVVTACDMIALHPYECVYFNRALAGGLPVAASRYDTDYWGNSYREGVAWVVAHYPGPYNQRLRVANTSTCVLTGYYVDKPIVRDRFEPECDEPGRPHFVLTTTRESRHEHVPGTLVHTVERQGVPLCYVFETRRPRPAP